MRDMDVKVLAEVSKMVPESQANRNNEKTVETKTVRRTKK